MINQPPPLPGRPFADQPAGWRIAHAGASVAGFVMCEQARGSTIGRAELVVWYASHTAGIADIYDQVHARALARLAEEDTNPTSYTAGPR
jgi:hypothetical protein